MKLKIEKETIFLLNITLINLLSGIFSFVMTQYGKDMRVVNFIILLVVNLLLFFVVIKNSEYRFKGLVICIWQYALMLDIMYRIVRYLNTPYEILYIFDIIGMILLLTFIHNQNIKKEDPILVLFVVIIFYCFFTSIFNNSDIVDFFGAIRLLIRYLGLYLYFQINDFVIPSWFKLFFVASIFTFIAECILDINQDFRNGLFGYMYTTEMFPLVLVAWMSYSIYELVCLHKSILRLGFRMVCIELCFLLMEAKAEMIIIVIYIVILFVVLKFRTQNLYNVMGKKVLGVLLICILTLISWNNLGRVFTKWTGWRGEVNVIGTVLDKGINQIFGNSFMNTIYNTEVSTSLQKIFGIGAGMSISPRGVMWFRQYTLDVNELHNIFKFSTIFNKYYYEIPSIQTIKLDLGIIGVLLFVILDTLLVYRCIVLLRSNNNMKKFVFGAVGLWQTIIFIYRFINNSILTEPLWVATSMVLFGVVTYQFYDLKVSKTRSLYNIS